MSSAGVRRGWSQGSYAGLPQRLIEPGVLSCSRARQHGGVEDALSTPAAQRHSPDASSTPTKNNIPFFALLLRCAFIQFGKPLVCP